MAFEGHHLVLCASEHEDDPLLIRTIRVPFALAPRRDEHAVVEEGHGGDASPSPRASAKQPPHTLVRRLGMRILLAPLRGASTLADEAGVKCAALAQRCSEFHAWGGGMEVRWR